jgi:hypothetical protein
VLYTFAKLNWCQQGGLFRYLLLLILKRKLHCIYLDQLRQVLLCFITLSEVLNCQVRFLIDLVVVALCFEFENFLCLRLGLVELASSVNELFCFVEHLTLVDLRDS